MTHGNFLIIDDHPLISGGIQTALRQKGHTSVCFSPTIEVHPETPWPAAALLELEALSLPPQGQFDLALVDLTMGKYADAGLHFIGPLVKRDAIVLVLTGVDEQPRLDACIARGAHAVLSKELSIAEIIEAIENVMAGQSLLGKNERQEILARHQIRLAARSEMEEQFKSLTEREERVLEGLMHGMNVATIAEESFVAESTVRSQVKSVLRKLGVSSQLEAVALANAAKDV